MPRKPRFNLLGVPQHVIQRGNNREPCFFSEADYVQYLENLYTAADKHQCHIHAYILMTNYVHLLVTPFMDMGISLMMQSLGRRYLLMCMRYIESNSVRANMIEYPGDYKWSSYSGYSDNAYGQISFDLKSHPLYLSLGNNSQQRREAYRKLFAIILDKESLHEVRDSLNHELVLGRFYFKDRI